ncbi:MAG: heat-inducible transcriptional repressor HrcA [Pseudomonadota bacterium]|nr:heat-inducible transcriptional repressor HrcA [Pseudomonadota bacterium]
MMKRKQAPIVPDERARHILRTLVEQFVRDGSPIGSRKLSKASHLSLSPATIRNVMSDLEELGLIASPHTSAGRIPTAKGYRMFVDTLVQLRPPADGEIQKLRTQLREKNSTSSQSIATSASAALSALTSMAGLVTLPRQIKVCLRQIEFLRISKGRILVILITDEGEVQNRILQLERDYDESELQRAANWLNDNYAGKEISSIRKLVVEELQRTQESMNQLMIDTVAFAERALPSNQNGYVLTGQTRLMDFQELSDVDKLRQLFEAFSEQREILGLLDRSIAADGVQIFIGEESGYQLLDECSVVTAPYRVNNEIVGVLGVIGPTRMAYERVIPIVDLTAKLVGSALNSSH